MAKRTGKGGPDVAPKPIAPEDDGLALAEYIVDDRKERIDKIQDEICSVLGVPNDEVFSSVVLKEFPYLKSDFNSVVKPAVAELLALYDGSKAELAPNEEQVEHNKLVAKIDDFLARLEADLQRLKESKGIVQKDPKSPDGTKKEKVEKKSNPAEVVGEISGRSETLKKYLEQFKADTYKGKVEEIKKLIEEVLQVKSLFDKIPSGSDKKVTEMIQAKYLVRLQQLDKDILEILGDLEDARLSQVSAGEYKNLFKSKAGKFVSPWGDLNEDIYKPVPRVETEEEKKKNWPDPHLEQTQSFEMESIPEKETVLPQLGENFVTQVELDWDSMHAQLLLVPELKIPDRIHPDLISFTNDHNDVLTLTRELRAAIQAGDIVSQKTIVDKIFALSEKWQNYLTGKAPAAPDSSPAAPIPDPMGSAPEAAPGAGGADPAATPAADKPLEELTRWEARVLVGKLDEAARKLVSSDPAVVAERNRLEAEAKKIRALPVYDGPGETSPKKNPDLREARFFMDEAKKPESTPEEKESAHNNAKEAWRHTKPAYDAAEAKYQELFAAHRDSEAAASEWRPFNKTLSNPALVAAKRERDEARQLYQESVSILAKVRLEHKKELVQKTEAEKRTNKDVILHQMPPERFNERVQRELARKLILNSFEKETEAEEKALAAHPGGLSRLRSRFVSAVTAPFKERLYDENGKIRRGNAMALGGIGAVALGTVAIAFPVWAAAVPAGAVSGLTVNRLSQKFGNWKWVKGKKDQLAQMQQYQQGEILGNVNVAEFAQKQAEQFKKIQASEKRVKWGSRALGAAAGFAAAGGVKYEFGDQISSLFAAQGAEMPLRASALRDPGELEFLRRATDTLTNPVTEGVASFDEGALYGAGQTVESTAAAADAPAQPATEAARSVPATESVPTAPTAERLKHVVEVQRRDNLWTLVQREYAHRGNNFQGVTPGQRDRILMEIFNEANADPALKAQIGLEARGGKPQDVHWIYEKQKVDLGPLLERLDEKVRAVRGVVDVPAPSTPPSVEVPVIQTTPLAPEVIPVYPGSAEDLSMLERPRDLSGSYDADYLPIDPGEAVPTAPLQERAQFVPELVPRGDEDMATIAAEMASQDRLQEQDAFDEVVSPPTGQPETPSGETDGARQLEAIGTQRSPLSIEQSQPGTRTFDAAVEAMGGRRAFAEARDALVESIETDERGGMGFWWRLFTAPTENPILTRLGDQSLSELYQLRSLPRAAQEQFLASQGIRRSALEAWVRGVEGLVEAVTEAGVKVDPNKVTLNQLINYATVRGATLSPGI